MLTRAITVKDYMATNLITLKPEMDVMDAVHLLLQNGISGATVVDNLGNIVGVLSEKDCIRASMMGGYHQERGGKVDEYMTREVKSIDAETSMMDVAKLFTETPFRRFPVISDDNRLVGQISRRDVLRALEYLY